MPKKRKLPKSLTRVTTFSKLLAILIIFAFIVSAFYAGIMFQQKYSSQLLSVTPTPTSVPSEQTICRSDSDCILTDVSRSALCCPNTACLDLSKDYVAAMNSTWVATRKENLCSGIMCPMIAAMCTREISEKNSHYSAKCVSSICTKVRN